MGLSIIPEEEEDNFKFAFQFLRVKNPADIQLNPCKASIYIMPLDFGPPRPGIMLYKKREQNSKHPMYFYNLFYKNYSIHFYFPLHKNDLWFYNKHEARLIKSPPLFSNPYHEHKTPYEYRDIDFSSFEPVKGEEEQWVAKMEDDPATRVAMNPKTFKIVKADVNNAVKGIYIIKDETFSIPIVEE